MVVWSYWLSSKKKATALDSTIRLMPPKGSKKQVSGLVTWGLVETKRYGWPRRNVVLHWGYCCDKWRSCIFSQLWTEMRHAVDTKAYVMWKIPILFRILQWPMPIWWHHPKPCTCCWQLLALSKSHPIEGSKIEYVAVGRGWCQGPRFSSLFRFRIFSQKN